MTIALPLGKDKPCLQPTELGWWTADWRPIRPPSRWQVLGAPAIPGRGDQATRARRSARFWSAANRWSRVAVLQAAAAPQKAKQAGNLPRRATRTPLLRLRAAVCQWPVPQGRV